MQPERNTSLGSGFVCRFFTTPQRELDKKPKMVLH
jgi:hypothetical protein